MTHVELQSNLAHSSTTAPPQSTEASSRQKSVAVLCVVALVIVVSLPLVKWLPDTSWHNQERLGQILVMGFALLAVTVGPLLGRTPVPSFLLIRAARTIALVMAGGLLSAMLAWMPIWGMTEVALAVGCVTISWTVAVMRRLYGCVVDRTLLAALTFIAAGLTARFVVAYVATLLSGSATFNSWLLLDGFSNPRFYGQFLTLALPILVAPTLAVGPLRRYASGALALTVLVWMIAITTGTRGTLLGLGVAAFALIWVGSTSRRWISRQCTGAAGGFVLFLILIVALPTTLGFRLENSATDRLTTSLSGRSPLWYAAIHAIFRHPILGIGPMQFAALPGQIAAHPHQAWLQWAAEWGLPSAFAVTWLVLWGALHVWRMLRARRDSRVQSDVLRVCIAGALVASLTQSMVDGVIVMPYTQLWLALLAGWMVGLHPSDAIPIDAMPNATSESKFLSRLWPLVAWAAIGLLLFVVVRDYPHVVGNEQATEQIIGGYYKPRFWIQGIINN